MDNNFTVWQLVARVLNGEASVAEQQELFEILRHDETLQQQYDLLTRIWKEKEGVADLHDKEAAQSAISRIISKAENENEYFGLPQNRNRFGKRKIWMVAASALVITVSAWLLLANRSADKSDKLKGEAIESKKGSKTRSMLPDGTTVWLNAGSKLSYDGDFRGAVRNVILEGEAFFEVIKDAKRPFIVHTSGIDIKVLGTAFNVKSYPEDKTVETTLYRGSVKVFREEESEDKAIQLKPNEKLILAKKAANTTQQLSDQVKPSTVNPPAANFTIAHIDSTKKENERLETAWLYSRLEFRGDNFEELARKLERWYNITIIFTDENVKQLAFNGSFENETVEQVFKYLKEAIPYFNYKINNNEISVGLAQ